MHSYGNVRIIVKNFIFSSKMVNFAIKKIFNNMMPGQKIFIKSFKTGQNVPTKKLASSLEQIHSCGNVRILGQNCIFSSKMVNFIIKKIFKNMMPDQKIFIKSFSTCPNVPTKKLVSSLEQMHSYGNVRIIVQNCMFLSKIINFTIKKIYKNMMHGKKFFIKSFNTDQNVLTKKLASSLGPMPSYGNVRIIVQNCIFSSKIWL